MLVVVERDISRARARFTVVFFACILYYVVQTSISKANKKRVAVAKCLWIVWIGSREAARRRIAYWEEEDGVRADVSAQDGQ